MDLQVRYSGDWDEPYFRDYLIEHPEVVARYSDLKLRLKERFEFDREGYTGVNTEFIAVITGTVRIELPKKCFNR